MDRVDFWLIWLFSMVVIFWAVIRYAQYLTRKKRSGELSNIEGFTATHILVGRDAKTAIAIDPDRKLLGIARYVGSARAIPFKDVLSVGLAQNGTMITQISKTSGLGGAALGGAVFGGAGAVVGALMGKRTTRERVTSVDIRIVINDVAAPTLDINLYNALPVFEKGQYANGIVITNIMKTASEWLGRLDVIVRDGATGARLPNEKRGAVYAENLSVADELTKLLGLRDQGVITGEQFEAQKTRLLNTDPAVSASSPIPEHDAPLAPAFAVDADASSAYLDEANRLKHRRERRDLKWSEALVWGVFLLVIGLGAYMMIRRDSSQEAQSSRSSPSSTPQLTAEQRINDEKLNARQKCRDTVQFTSHFPTKASFYGSTLGRDVDVLPGGGFTVRGRVDLMNSFGAMIPYSFICTIGADGKLKLPLSITPG